MRDDQFIVLTVSTPDAIKVGLLNKWMMLNILEKTNFPVIVLSVHVKYDPKALPLTIEMCIFCDEKYTCDLNVCNY